MGICPIALRAEIYSAGQRTGVCRMRLRLLPCLSLVSLCCLAALPSQQTNSPSEQIPVFRTRSHAVGVDVVVTGGDKAVTGLHTQDFQVFEDGKPVTVDFFEEHTAKTFPPG